MDIMTLLARFADPETIAQLSLSQKMTASLITTLLGMGITFLSLIILQFVISLLARVSNAKAVAATEPEPQPAPQAARQQEHELVAAITAALAIQLDTAASNIVIRNIRKVENHAPAWSRVGLAELMDNHS